MAGASNRNKIRLTARQQWFDVENAPGLQTFNIHARLRDKIGVGGIIFNDHNGNFSKRGVYATFAYHLLLSDSELDLNQLSFGISGGLIQHSLDQSSFSGSDPLIGAGNASDIYANMDVGISYYYFDFFLHFTAKNLLPIRKDLFYSEAVPVNQRKYLFSTGYDFSPTHSRWSYEPSILFQWKEQTQERFADMNFKVYRGMQAGGLFAGISYRRSFDAAGNPEHQYEQLQYMTPFLGIQYKDFLFAYTYSQQLNSVVLSNSGFHQITLGYNFGKSRERHDCGCHAINDDWH